MESNGNSELEPEVQLKSQKLSHHTQQHLQEVWAALFTWHLNTAMQDFPYSCFTSAVILPDPILTCIASNCCITTILDLRTLLPIKWAFQEQYGHAVLGLIAKIDKEYHHQHEAQKPAKQDTRHTRFEQRATEKADGVEKQRCSCLIQHAKENCVIPGTGWYVIHISLSSFSLPTDSFT